MEHSPKMKCKKQSLVLLAVLGLAAFLFTLYLDHFILVYESPLICFLLLLWLIGLVFVAQKKRARSKIAHCDQSFSLPLFNVCNGP